MHPPEFRDRAECAARETRPTHAHAHAPTQAAKPKPASASIAGSRPYYCTRLLARSERARVSASPRRMCTRRGPRSRGFHSSVKQARTKASRVDRSGRLLHRACFANVRLCRRHRRPYRNRVGVFAVPASRDRPRLVVVGRAHSSERGSADLVAKACLIGSDIGKPRRCARALGGKMQRCTPSDPDRRAERFLRNQFRWLGQPMRCRSNGERPLVRNNVRKGVKQKLAPH